MYGIYLCISPAGGKHKRVVIHKRSCNFYKCMAKKGKSKGLYSFNKYEKTLRDALNFASYCSLEWHAPIVFCKKCFKIGSSIECVF
ncbi:MAG: hypothetical protein AB1349_06050 [Elusimicrobiota bacterium]